ncbi:MAG: hypothetical protein JWO73_430 [Candidatus Taylorbacteria bacterium]|nr:hypothetical protein [Candidatus Taylorbacteria bacterium]
MTYRTLINLIREKWQHAGFQKHFQNIGWMFFARLGSMAISFVSTAYIARNLGAANYGQLSYATSFVGLFGFLASFGIEQILCRDLVRHPEKRNGYMGSAMTLRLAASSITTIVCIISAFIWSPKDVSFILICIVSLTFIFSSFQLLSYEFQAEAKSKGPSILSTLIVLILNILKIGVMFYGGGVIYLAGVLLLEPILYTIGILYLRTREYGTIRNWKFDKAIAKSIARDSFPLIFASAFFAIYARIDQVMIKNMLSSESVGLYDSAVRISELWYFIPNIIIGGLFPAIINAKKTSEELYYRRTKKLFILIAGISVLTALPTALFSNYLVIIIFGTGFIGAVGVLKIYVWSNIGAALNLMSQQLLITENMTKIILATTFLGMITNVGLNLVMIPKYGMAGAAYASLISYVVPFFSLILFKKSRKILLNLFR